MAEHTPGPWKVPAWAEWQIQTVNGRAGDTAIARTYSAPWDGRGEAETLANAHLIAAAPELLDACKYLCAEIHNGCTNKDEVFMQGVAKVETIVAKAEGRETA
jgi:hypothetical protein